MSENKCNNLVVGLIKRTEKMLVKDFRRIITNDINKDYDPDIDWVIFEELPNDCLKELDRVLKKNNI